MFLDNLPNGNRKYRPSASSVQRIQKGGERADKVKAMREKQHREHEIPQAEAQINAALSDWPEDEKTENRKEQKKRPLSILLLEFFHSFFS